MQHHDVDQPDFGTGQKKLSIYLFGVTSCVLLTILSFWTVMSGRFERSKNLLLFTHLLLFSLWCS